ncbi:undecaprenyl-diphosphate phosphatase [Candidatus Bathyarchaeota archaeon]|nr:MAG: undecaprenyl-diphosphate phosphatase [Candidatus Bathyarchaeota archaeon]
MGFQATPLFNVFLHLGTLGVVIFYFRRDIKVVLKALFHRAFHSEYCRFIPLIIVVTIPTGIIGLLYDKYLADSYQTFLFMGITFIIGATLIVLSKFGKENHAQISYRKSLVMGVAQGAASFQDFPEMGQQSQAVCFRAVSVRHFSNSRFCFRFLQ